MVEYKTRHVTPNGVVMDDYHFEVSNIKYVGKSVPDDGTLYVFSILKQ